MPSVVVCGLMEVSEEEPDPQEQQGVMEETMDEVV